MRSVSDKLLTTLVVILISIITYVIDDYRTIGSLYFYIVTVYLAFSIVKLKSIHLIHVWLFGFLFIIVSEVNSSKSLFESEYLLSAVRFLFVANNIIFLSYYLASSQTLINKNYQTIVKKKGLFVLIFFLGLYVAVMFEYALNSFLLGKSAAGYMVDQWILNAIIGSLGYLLPASFLYYFSKQYPDRQYLALIFSAPIWIILFMIGTRFPLLFSTLGYIIVWISTKKEIKLKHYVITILCGFMLFLSAAIMKKIRGGAKYSDKEIFQTTYSFNEFPALIGSYMTDEAVVNMTSELIKYYDAPSNEHKYGVSSSFILYFWIPRSLWEEKPTMLGYWFFRQINSNVDSQYSAAFGYTGDLFVDFGYFSLIFMFFFGTILRKLQNKFERFKATTSIYIIIGAMFYPLIFFFVRSPVTSLMNFLGILLFFYILKHLVFPTQVISNKT